MIGVRLAAVPVPLVDLAHWEGEHVGQLLHLLLAPALAFLELVLEDQGLVQGLFEARGLQVKATGFWLGDHQWRFWTARYCLIFLKIIFFEQSCILKCALTGVQECLIFGLKTVLIVDYPQKRSLFFINSLFQELFRIESVEALCLGKVLFLVTFSKLVVANRLLTCIILQMFIVRPSKPIGVVMRVNTEVILILLLSGR